MRASIQGNFSLRLARNVRSSSAWTDAAFILDVHPERLPVRTILIANRCLWAALIPQFAWVHNVYALGAILAVMLLMGPAGSTAVITSQMAITPEDMQGRASSARGFCTGLAAPAGTALIGYALVQLGLTASVLALTTSLVLMAAIASTSPSLRAKTSRAVAPACTNVP
jgi:hypothetical protein